MPNPTIKSDSDEIEEYDPDINELLSIEYDFSDKLKEILKKLGGSEESEYRLNTYLFLLNNISKNIRINWVFIGNHVVRHLGKLESSHQTEILDYILSKIDAFSNKQLAMLYKTLTKIMRILELKNEKDKSATHFKKIKAFRHQILQEMSLKSRYKENSIDDIILKYFENPQEAIQQLVNKNQFLKDFKVIVNNLDKFTKEQLEEYFNFIKNGILKYVYFNPKSQTELKFSGLIFISRFKNIFDVALNYANKHKGLLDEFADLSGILFGFFSRELAIYCSKERLKKFNLIK